MNTYQFTLFLSGVAEVTPESADALSAATGGDIEFNMRNDVAYIEFDRAADTLQDAVNSAIAQVEGAGVGVRWRSPVGPLRADVAYGDEEQRWRLHFSVGIAF